MGCIVLIVCFRKCIMVECKLVFGLHLSITTLTKCSALYLRDKAVECLQMRLIFLQNYVTFSFALLMSSCLFSSLLLRYYIYIYIYNYNGYRSSFWYHCDKTLIPCVLGIAQGNYTAILKGTWRHFQHNFKAIILKLYLYC